MAIYQVLDSSLSPVRVTSFEAERLSERGDLQRLLKENIACLEEGLMVLAEEFSDWTDSSRRIDLLCLDTSANLVVVELKRTSDGGHMELQALRYAAMVSEMTFEQAVDTYARHRSANGQSRTDHEAARAEILGFLNWGEVNEDDFAKDTRILLASADFSKELTTSVMWLRDRLIDIRCVRLKPYRLEGGPVLLDIQQLIPLPEASEFQTQIGAKRRAIRGDDIERHVLRRSFWEGLLNRARSRNSIHANKSPTNGTIISGSTGRAGFDISYGLRQWDNSVYLWIANNRPAFNALLEQKDEIELAFGQPLVWKDEEGQLGRQIGYFQDGGYRSDPDTWPEIQERMIAAMLKFGDVMLPCVRNLTV